MKRTSLLVTGIMRKRAWLLFATTILAAMPAVVLAQDKYPIQVVPVGKGPYNFPKGFRTDFSKVNIMVTEKLSPNLYVLHGNAGVDSAHPDASGGRMTVLFGDDGVLLVDSENEPVGAKSLAAIRTFTQAPIKILVNSHAHPDHTGGDAFFAKQGALIFAQENLRDEMMPNPNAGPRPAGAPPAQPLDPASLPVVTYKYDPTTEGKPAVTIHMDGETVDFIPMMPSHMGGDTVVRFEKSQCDLCRGFLPQFRLSLRRSGQWRLDQGHAESN